LALRLADALEQLGVDVVGVLGEGGAERLEDLADRLVELELAGVAGEDHLEDRFELLVDVHDWVTPLLRSGMVKHDRPRRAPTRHVIPWARFPPAWTTLSDLTRKLS